MEAFDLFDPFEVANAWHKPAVFQSLDEDEPLGLFAELDLDISSPKTDYVAAIANKLHDALDLPQLESFEPSEPEEGSASASDDSVFSAELEFPALLSADDDFNVWNAVLEEQPSEEGKRLYSWEAFTNVEHVEPISAYLWEAGVDAFDAAIGLHGQQATGNARESHAIQADPLLKAIVALSMGRSSLFFSWNEQTHQFEQVIKGTRILSHSLASSQALLDLARQCGTNIRQLKVFTSRTFRSTTFQASVAFARSIDTIISVIEDYLSSKSLKLRSFLQLSALLERPLDLLTSLMSFMESVRRGTSEADLASKAYEHVQGISQSTGEATKILKLVFARMGQPSLSSAFGSIGLANPTYNATRTLQDTLDLPRFMNEEATTMFHQIKDSLRLLRTHDPDNALCHGSSSYLHSSQLDIKFSWSDIERVTAKADLYEQELSTTVLSIQQAARRTECRSVVDNPLHQEQNAYDWAAFEHAIERSPTAMSSSSLPFTPNSADHDSLKATVDAHLRFDQHDDLRQLDPELALCPLLSFSPVLAAQSRLVNAAVLRLIFRSSHLRPHLELQYQYHCLGNGSFVARLSSALFDPTRATAERHKGILRTHESMGLRLGSRKTWPPASSELQLALIGILAECYQNSNLSYDFGSDKNIATNAQQKELPGALSFSVRQLPTDEAERCMQADSLYALDFLRLQYSAISPIDAIVSDSSLDKYDRIFMALLRIQRLIFVVSTLPKVGLSRSALAFRLEVHHFVSSCAKYFFDTGVVEAWQAFRTFLDGVEMQLEKEDATGKLHKDASRSLDDLRRAHENCLDRIMFTLLLRQRYAQVMALLEEIFGIILVFSKDPQTINIGDLASIFREKVLIFIKVCHGLSGKHGDTEGNSVERLLLALEGNGYYDRVR